MIRLIQLRLTAGLFEAHITPGSMLSQRYRSPWADVRSYSTASNVSFVLSITCRELILLRSSAFVLWNYGVLF